MYIIQYVVYIGISKLFSLSKYFKANLKYDSRFHNLQTILILEQLVFLTVEKYLFF